jgi:hypothetical protein
MKILLSTRVLASAALTGFLLSCSGTGYGQAVSTQRLVCSENTLNWIAATYATAEAYPASIHTFTTLHKPLLEAPAFRHCLDRFAQQLVSDALRAPSYNDIYSRSMAIATNAGAPELGPKVAKDLAQSAGDFLRLAGQLDQLFFFTLDGLDVDLSTFGQNDYQSMAVEGALGTEYAELLQVVTAELSFWYVSVLAQQIR